MNRFIKGVATLALLGALAAPASSQMVPGTWYTFSWSGLGTVSSTFVVGGAGAMDIQVVDCCLIGDEFEIFAGGSSLGLTSDTDPLLDGVSSGASGGDGSWANPDLSKGQFRATAGDVISIDVVAVTSATSSGGAYIRTVTPEPGTVILMATGLFGLGVAMRRREDSEEDA